MRLILFFEAISMFVALATANSPTVISYLAFSASNYDALGAYSSTVARVIGIDKYATTYEIGCMKSAAECGYPHYVTLIQGPNTWAYWGVASVTADSATEIQTFTESCKLAHYTESVVCAGTYTLTLSDSVFSTATIFSASDLSISASAISYRTVTVTDGLYAFTAAATASTSAVRITATATTSTSTSTSTGIAAPAVPMMTVAPLAAAAAAAAVAIF